MAARARFGSWRAALTAAGIPDHAHRKHRCYWTPNRVCEAIRALFDAGVSLSQGDLTFDTSPALREIIKERTGLAVTGSMLMNGARRHFGSWKVAILAAGLEPLFNRESKTSWNGTKKTPMTMTWSESHLCSMVRFLSQRQVDLRVSSMLSKQSKPKLERELLKQYGKISLFNVVSLSRNYNGSWKKSVLSAGIDPRYHLRSRRRKVQGGLVIEPHVIQTESAGDEGPRRILHLGTVTPDPEMAILNEELRARFDEVIEQMDSRQRSIAEMIFDASCDGKEFAIDVIFRRHPEYSRAEVDKAFLHLRRSFVDFR